MAIEDIREILSESMSIKAKMINEKESFLMPKELAKIKKSMDSELRLYIDLLPLACSEAALVLIKEKNICKKGSTNLINLFDENWDTQTQFDVGRKLFSYEHFWTISSLKGEILNSNHKNEVNSILSKALVIWITTEENKQLDILRYKSRRPDPHKAYKDAGIKIVFKD